MGYRSDVAIAFYPSSRDNPVPFSTIKLWFDENYPHRMAVDEWSAEIDAEADFILVRYRNVKWYEGYEHVVAVENAIRLFNQTFETGEEDTGAAYEFARIGEETGDFEEDASPWSDCRLMVRREIIFE
jgi:hypothetical protein